MTTAWECIEDLTAKDRIIVVLGPGGVGKTTTSIAVAIQGAYEGRKVALLSIDPAKRLADAMNITLGDKLSEVSLPADCPGQLKACMLDQAAVFDSMVTRHASPKLREKIFSNSVYQQVSKNLGGPLEYMALAKLNELIMANEFDLVVLDTPPDTHALDFLVRPNILAGFVEKGVMTWLIKPFYLAQKFGFGKLLSMGEKLMGGLAHITGVSMLERLSEFLVIMEEVIHGFNLAGKQVAEKLRGPHARFILVLSPVRASVRSGLNIVSQLKAEGFPLHAMLANRVLRSELREEISALDLGELPSDLDQDVRELLSRFQKYQGMAKSLLGQLKKEADARWATPVPMLIKEEQKDMIHNLEGMIAFAKSLRSAQSFEA